ncbi:MAG: hypothetical protein L3V56_05880 [Candidatus Magnetoovum sp. WYHC-5]|nr:hypothetical protein [Candidatus Magnetoovum sp. WYHC-5]
MSKRDKLLRKIKNNLKDVRFCELTKVVELYGFVNVHGEGSHQYYLLKGTKYVLNLQSDKNGKAKPYQVRQFLKILKETED